MLALCILSFMIAAVYFDIRTPQYAKAYRQSIDSKKYVIYECTNKNLCGGLGDRLKGIMSAYAWSLVTNRIFLIRHYRPCLLTEMFQVNKLNWNIDTFNRTKETNANTQVYYLIDNVKFRDALFNYTQFDSNITYVVFKNNVDWLEPLSKNPISVQRLRKLGFEMKKFKLQYMFKKWYEMMFKLSPSLEMKYKQFQRKAKPNRNSLLVCAQVRIGGKREFVAYDGPFTEIGNTKVYWNYIKKEFIRNRTDFKLFLTTDTKSIEHEAEKEFGKMNVIINDGPLRHLDRELNLGKQHCHRVEKTFLDFHCLQLCDMAIISESGFGKLGVWNRPNPSEKLAMFTKMQKLVVFNNSNELIII